MAISTESSSLLSYNNLHIPNDLQVVIVYTEWNEAIIQQLLKGAQSILSQFPQVSVNTVQVPGAVELTYAVRTYMDHPRIKADVIIAFGCVIRGETPHFDYVCQSVTQGITTLNAQGIIPIIFGVLTVNHEQEAYDRLGGKHGHKGEEAAIAALKMISLTENQIQTGNSKS